MHNLFNKDVFIKEIFNKDAAQIQAVYWCNSELNANLCSFFPLRSPDFSSTVLHATAAATEREQLTSSCDKALLRSVTH